MKGSTEIKVNHETMVEAMQMYFDSQFSTGKRMTVTDVKADPSKQYGPEVGFVAYMTEATPPTFTVSISPTGT